MKTMSKRDRIMMLAAIVAVLAGIYSLIGPSKKNGVPHVQAMEVHSFIKEELDRNAKEMPSAFDSYVVQRAGTDWERNPFSEKAGLAGMNAIEVRDEVSKLPDFLYSGYMEIGTRKVAIIDGIEYMIGDPVEKEGGNDVFFVKNISSSSVLIENRRGKTKHEIPLSE